MSRSLAPLQRMMPTTRFGGPVVGEVVVPPVDSAAPVDAAPRAGAIVLAATGANVLLTGSGITS